MSAEKPHQKNSGLMYPNKKTHPKAPDYGGEATVHCASTGATLRVRVAEWNKIGSQSKRTLHSLQFVCQCDECKAALKRELEAKKAGAQ